MDEEDWISQSSEGSTHEEFKYPVDVVSRRRSARATGRGRVLKFLGNGSRYLTRRRAKVRAASPVTTAPARPSLLDMAQAWESAKFIAQAEKLKELERRIAKLDHLPVSQDALTDRPKAGQRGGAFSHWTMIQANRGSLSITLTPNAWSAALIAPLLDTRSNLRVAAVIPQYVGLLLTVTAQVVFTWYLHQIVMSSGKSCKRGAGLLRFMCICVLFASVASTELLETLSFRRWLRAVPRWDEELHRPIAEKNHTYLAMRRITSVNSENTVYCLATGITDGYRCFAHAFLIFPKLTIAIVMLTYSSGYIVYAESNENIFLNTLATLLIIDVDNYAYDYLTTSSIKLAFEELPPLGFLGRQDLARSESGPHNNGVWAYLDDEIWFICGGLALIPLMFVAAASLYSGWCMRTTQLKYLIFLSLCIPLTVVATGCFVAGRLRAETTNYADVELRRMAAQEAHKRKRAMEEGSTVTVETV